MLAASMQQAGMSGHEEDESLHVLSQRWTALIESLVKGVLVWAQSVQGKDEEESAEAGVTCAGFDV